MNSEPQQTPEIAVIARNVLVGVGLKALLDKIIPVAEVTLFSDFGSFAAAGPDRFFHYFVSAQLFREEAAFFRQRHQRTILLTDGAPRAAFAGMHTLDLFTSEEQLAHDILQMHRGAHPRRGAAPAAARPVLSEREEEVLRQIVGGAINKQIADRLGIGLTTVITHRRNIMEKMGVRSVAELILRAVAEGYAAPEGE